jgi:hypothetical protein
MIVLGVGARVVALACDEPGVVLVEAVGDVFEEDEPEYDVLVFGRVYVVAQLVRGEPELGLESEVGRRVGLVSVGCAAGHRNSCAGLGGRMQ